MPNTSQTADLQEGLSNAPRDPSFVCLSLSLSLFPSRNHKKFPKTTLRLHSQTPSCFRKVLVSLSLASCSTSNTFNLPFYLSHTITTITANTHSIAQQMQ